MIRIERGEEPPALAGVRELELERVGNIELTQPATGKQIGTKYQLAHEALWKAQHHKCCYCECREQSKRNDVEHYRPKARARREPGSTASYGYWWLAWSWENLLFSCRNCNQAPAKLDKFPLELGSIPLVTREQPPGGELPLLIDPAAESGCEHIVFLPELQHGALRWRPVARSGSLRGEHTIRVCMLDRPDLLDLYAFHVDVHVRPLVDKILDAIARADEAEVRLAWRRATETLLDERQCFVGLARDAIDYFIPQSERETWGLVLPSR